MPQTDFINYFAFGSNMSYQQIVERLGPVPKPLVDRLIGYKLTFNKHSKNRSKEYNSSEQIKVGAANIIFTGNSADVVEGMLYKLTKEQMIQLDKNEGYRLKSGALSKNSKGYKKISMHTESGSFCETYVAQILADDPDNELKPSAAYIKLFLKADLSLAYYQKLLDIAVVDGGKIRDYVTFVPKMHIAANRFFHVDCFESIGNSLNENKSSFSVNKSVML